MPPICQPLSLDPRGARWLCTHPPHPVDQVIELGNDVLATAAGDVGFPRDNSRALLDLDRAERNSPGPSLSRYFPAQSLFIPRGCDSLRNDNPTRCVCSRGFSPSVGSEGLVLRHSPLGHTPATESPQLLMPRAHRAAGSPRISAGKRGDAWQEMPLEPPARGSGDTSCCSPSPGQELLPVSAIGHRRLMEQLSANGTHSTGPGGQKGPAQETG